MSFERKSFRSLGPGSHIIGTVIEYDPTRNPDTSGGWKWAVCLVLLLAGVVSFVSARGCLRFKQGTGADDPVSLLAVPQVPKPVTADAPTNLPAAKPANAEMKQVPLPAEDVREWVMASAGRPQRERTLLARLADAETLGRFAIAVDTIEQLRAQPSMADLDDKLARRLGDLNIRRLYSGEPVPWIVEATVRRGQTVHRVAREHGTTVAAVRRLNGLGPKDELTEGSRLRVLEFPRATFVVHKNLRYADLTLGGKLFKRYYVMAKRNAAPGAYPITSKPEEGPRARFSALGVRVAPADMLELDMFLAPGSTLTIAEM